MDNSLGLAFERKHSVNVRGAPAPTRCAQLCTSAWVDMHMHANANANANANARI